MKKLSEFNPQQKINTLFCDIDDTLTNQGQLGPEAYTALWTLAKNGIQIVPVTGRPAGWCEMIARFWPVKGIVGENGAFYFTYKDKKMHRNFVFDESTRRDHQMKLENVRAEVLSQIEGAQVASDQFCRLFDLAIDFCEDVEPLPSEKIQQIVSVFHKHGAQAKISSIHVNGWFGDYNKLSMCKSFVQNELGGEFEQSQSQMAFVGDSPNDEPMFEAFENSFAVSNIKPFLDQLKFKPQYITPSEGGFGFCELVEQILA